MNLPNNITELIKQSSLYKFTNFEMKLAYELFAKKMGYTFKENLTSYSIWDKEFCLVRFDLATRTQILENEQKQIAGKELNLN